ncbi:MAG: hypothetical protein QN189_03210 [Armatimonadota bacterium]|nr:hypothetical protein [Armatimonadota bacterium]
MAARTSTKVSRRNLAGVRTIPIKVRYPEGVPTLYVHGAWGGVGPKGEIIVYLYQESQEFPSAFQVTVDARGKVQRHEAVEYSGAVEREVLAKLLMPPEVARAVGEWLKSKAEEFEKLTRDLASGDREAGPST